MSKSMKKKKTTKQALLLPFITLLLCSATLFPAFAQEKQPASRGKGAIAGAVLDERGQPVPGAIAIVLGLPSIGATTGVDGKYTLADIPAGTTTVQISLMTYETLLVEGVEVVAGRTTPLHVVLKEATTQLGEVVVTANYRQASAAGLYAAQKLNASMTDGISADMIARTSDNNVAQALKRVAGVIINDGKFVTVRGISERYNNVQLNGASLPSTEPNRRNFAFDIIPVALIDNVVVSKTFTPDLNGEFTGGLVEVKTLSFSDEPFLNLSLGTGTNSISTGKDFQSNKRYMNDYFLGEMNKRTWFAGHTPEEIAQSGLNAQQINHYGFNRYTAVPVQNYAVSGGLPLKLDDKNTLSLVTAISYRHEETTEKIKDLHTFGRDSLKTNLGERYNHNYKFVSVLGAIANIGWKNDSHAISWRNLFNNRFTHTSTDRFMHDFYDMMTQYEQYATPLQARLVQTQLDGKHAFFKQNLTLTWNADYSTTTRINPDDRYALGDVTGRNWLDSDRNVIPSADGNYAVNWAAVGPSRPYVSSQFVMYSGLDETKKNAGVNLEYRFKLFNRQHRIKGGYLHSSRTAEYNQQYFHTFISTIGGANHLINESLHRVYDPANFNDGTFYYKPAGFSDGQADYYRGTQTVTAAYVMADIHPVKPLHIIGGVRMENTEADVFTRSQWYSDSGFRIGDSLFVRTDRQPLPSLTAVYSINSRFNVRASYSKTLARPDFRELAVRSKYWNVIDRIEVVTENAIEQSSTKNYDLRLEYYPGLGEVISLSAFYKDFDKPVEKMAQVKSDLQNYRLLTVNLDRSILRGIELNIRKSFGFAAHTLEDLWLAVNVAMLEGNIESENYKGKRERPLQGLAPYSINGSLAYEGRRAGASVNYTRIGRVLVIGGEFAKHDQYENPRNVLDFQLFARFMKQRLEVKLNVSDVLNEDIIIYRNCDSDSSNDGITDPGSYHDRTSLGMDYNEGDWVVSRINKGVNFSLSAAWKF
jgi:TonB-dependent receptor